MKALTWIIGVAAIAAACLGQNAPGPRAEALTRKLDAIVITRIEFNEASLRDVVDYLRDMSERHGPDKTGVNIVLMDRENPTKITLTLHGVSLRTALRFVAEMAGLSLDVEDEAVVLRKRADGKK